MKENKFVIWAKQHKTELIIGGCVVLTTIGAIFLGDDWETVKAIKLGDTKRIPSCSRNIVTEVPIVPAMGRETIVKIVDVKKHLRNLPSGHHPSILKLAEAAESGIELAEKQTIISAHPRRYVA